MVASAAVFGQHAYSLRLSRAPARSICRAEDNATPLALKFVASSDENKCMTCLDSLSWEWSVVKLKSRLF